MKNHMNQMLHRPYLRLFIMAVISFKFMYFLMYAMVDTWGNVWSNYNQFYMAGLMASPMVILELVLMKGMYEKRKWNALIIFFCLFLTALFWSGIRNQARISDEQFLRSMIPHHGGAILMCGKAELEDVELKELCRNIIFGQQAEIDFMKTKLNSLNK